MKVRFQAMGTSPGTAWIDDREALEEFGKKDAISEIEISLPNGPTIIIEEVIDSLTKDAIVSHLEMHVQPHDTASTEYTFSPCTVYPCGRGR